MIEKRQLREIRVPHCGQFSSIYLVIFKLLMPSGIYLLHILNFVAIITKQEIKSLFTNIWIRILGWYVLVKH